MVLTAEVAAGAWAVHNSAKLDSVVRSAIKYTVNAEYSKFDAKTAAFDSFQQHVRIAQQNLKVIFSISFCNFNR